MRKSKSEILPLTSLRFFLAAWVVIFHRVIDGPPKEYLVGAPTALLGLLNTGYVAVTLFFILSGFVLSLNYPLTNSWNYRDWMNFGNARLARIYPVYLLALIMISPFIMSPVLRNPSTAAILRKMFSGSLNLFFLQSWLPQTALSWNGPGWSLSAEAFFYAAFPIVGVAVWRISKLRIIFLYATLLWFVGLLAPLICVLAPAHQFGDQSAIARPETMIAHLIMFNPILQLPSFCIGVLLARVFKLQSETGSRVLHRGYLLYTPGFLVLFMVLGKARDIPYPLMHSGLAMPALCSIVFGLAANGGFIARILSTRPLVLLGRASYSLYIFQLPVWLGLTKLVGGDVYRLNYTLLYLAVLVLISVAVYRFVEEPCNRLIRTISTVAHVRSMTEPVSGSLLDQDQTLSLSGFSISDERTSRRSEAEPL
jgi:peptidoglycan/LPS O-acetylase OafA/YrhL